MSFWSRRRFLVRSAQAGLGVALGNAVGCGGPRVRPRPVAAKRYFFADLHVHPSLNRWVADSYLGRVNPLATSAVGDLFNKTRADWKACHAAGIDMMCVAHFSLFDEWVSMPTDPNPDAPRQSLRMLDALELELELEASRYARVVRNPHQLEQVLAHNRDHPGDRRIAVVHTLEGGHALGGDLTALDRFARRGVASITVTHFFNKGLAPAANSFPFFPDGDSPHLEVGMSAFGRRVVERMKELGIVIDISHAPAEAAAEMIDIAGCPLIASHSSAHALGDHPYSLRDEHIERLVALGGLFGVILMPYWLSNYSDAHRAETRGGLGDVVRTARHVANLTGTHRGLAIGSDFGGYIPGLPDIDRLSHIHRLRDALLAEFSEDEVEDILAGNVIRFYRENWGKPCV